MPIHILNKKTYNPVTQQPWIDQARVIYVGRPSILGNPYYHEKAIPSWSVDGYLIVTTRVATREDAVQRYGSWLRMHLETWRTAPNACASQVWREILRIAELIKKEPDQEWGLMCWCSPDACHADVIKRAIEWILSRGKHRLENVPNMEGVSHCVVCGGAEGGLPTECPGRKLTAEEGDQIYDGLLDYKDGQWTNFPIK
jgi:hypothetical protein